MTEDLSYWDTAHGDDADQGENSTEEIVGWLGSENQLRF